MKDIMSCIIDRPYPIGYSKGDGPVLLDEIRIISREFIEVPEFSKNWKELGFSQDNLESLQDTIMRNPKTGTAVKGTDGLRKMRYALSNRGKSGSVRVCYIDLEKVEKTILITVYNKKEKDNLPLSERKILRKLIMELKKTLRSLKMSEVFNSIVRGLNEAIDDKNIKTSKRTVLVIPVKQYTANEIRSIRMNARLTQRLFAEYMGVSIKTVEAWESGKNTPSGSSSRLLSMFEMDEALTERFPFVSIQ